MDQISSLIEIGFTEYEARVYLALLADYPATGYQLSKQSGIPRSMVYEALGRLHARGAVLRTEEGRATLYRPVPPDSILDRHEKEQHRLVQELRESLRRRYKAVEEDYLWSLTGRSAVMPYAVELIQSAHEELMLVLTDMDLEDLFASIRDSNLAGASLNILLTGSSGLATDDLPRPELARVARHPPLESQLQQLSNLLVIVADGKACLIGTSDPSPDLAMTGTFTNNRHLAYIVRQFVWMELFTQSLHTRLGHDLFHQFSTVEQVIFENLFPKE
jgi:HTH-type transcriptional regulator, sugar sensing transcriptional regulator